MIVEPVAANMGVVEPKRGFLQDLRSLCTKYGALLIFDEVITGFRLGLDGAQGYYGVKPDLTTFGKIIGGGMPVGAYGGIQRDHEPCGACGQCVSGGNLERKSFGHGCRVYGADDFGEASRDISTH